MINTTRAVFEGHVSRIQWGNYPGSVAIDMYDMLYLDASGNVQPATALAHGASNKADRILFAQNFIGLAGAAKLATSIADPYFPVITDCGMDMVSESVSPSLAQLVAISNNSGNNGLLNDTLILSTDPAEAIGKIWKPAASTTLLRCRLVSRLLDNGHPNGVFGEIVQPVAFGAMTPSGATGTLDTTDKLPAGAVVLGWHFNTTTGFTGDTSAVIEAGLAGALTAFSAITTKSVFAPGLVGSAAVVATAENPSEASVRITITSGSSFAAVTAGAGVFKLRYFVPNTMR